MIRSRLLDGLRGENAEAVRGQVWAFDHATVLGEVNRRVLRAAKAVPADAVRHAREDGLVIPLDDGGWRAAKLARIFRHLGIRFEYPPSAAELLDLCLEAEEKAVALLAKLQGPGKAGKGQVPFVGRDVLQLAQYVMRRLFDELDAGFAAKSAEEQERIATGILNTLAELPADVRERIRVEAGLAELSTGALRRTGAIAAVGGAMVGTVGMAGFAAYATLTSTIAAVAGLFGLHLSFAVYKSAVSLLAAAATPWVTGPLAIVWGGTFLVRANQQMRDRLLPVMVATAVLADADEGSKVEGIDLAACFAQAHARAIQADRQDRALLYATYPCLPK